MHTPLILSLVLFSGTDAAEAERRALEYLAREVPRWSVENNCYSCHNNGDAARALYAAKGLGRPFPDAALRDTTDWLARPAGWQHNGGEGEFSDKKLAAIQFAFALTAAREAGAVREREPLQSAARLLTAEQESDGSWRIDGSGAIGGPATYGRFLATAAARAVLAAAGMEFQKQTELADHWLRECRPETVLDAAAVLIGLADADDAAAKEQRAQCLDLVRRGEAREGGWGPYVNSPPKPFDTAVVLLALRHAHESRAATAMIARGRQYLIVTQLEDGSWPETTRPPGGTSYAQRASTTGWATQALLLTGEAAE
jgi:hypothetical protein